MNLVPDILSSVRAFFYHLSRFNRETALARAYIFIVALMYERLSAILVNSPCPVLKITSVGAVIGGISLRLIHEKEGS